MAGVISGSAILFSTHCFKHPRQTKNGPFEKRVFIIGKLTLKNFKELQTLELDWRQKNL
jgi:hypothetical protein